MLTLTPVVTILAAAALIVSAQAPQGKGEGKGGGKGGGKGPAGPPEITQLKPNLYMVTGLGGNTTVRVTNEGLLVVDTKNLGEANYNQLMDTIKKVTPQPAKFAVITHVHQDHSGNTASFLKAGAQVVAHEGEKALLATYTSNAGTPAAPSVTYARDYTIRLGGTEAKLYHYGPAHTKGDTIVHFPDLRVIAGGDVIPNGQPNCDFPNGGSVVNWPKFLDEVLKLDFDTLVPGHGAVMTKADVQEYKKKWETLVSRAVDAVKKGTPKDQLLASIKTDDIGWNINTQQWSQAARLDPFYAELQAAAK
jgi:glyoxylase-like metal-dependent hydrolase (beta-lactamase superfamily II)